MIFIIAWRELRTLFLTPLAWVVVAVVQLLFTIVFLGQLLDYTDHYTRQYGMLEGALGVTEFVVPQLFWIAFVVFVIVVPLITMRLLAEEQRSKTLTLLYSAPISMTEIALGKYLGACGFLLVNLLLLTMLPLSLAFGAAIDYGLLISAVLGLALVLADFIAVGLFMSSLTQYAAIAAISTFGLLLLLWLLDMSGQGLSSGSLLAYFSLANHYIPFLQGIFDSTSLFYHALLIATFLVLTIRRLDAARVGA